MNLQALARLVRMSMRGRRMLGTLLFVGVVTLASAAFVAGIGSRQDAGQLWDGAFERALGPHVTLHATTADDLRAASADPRVVAASEPVIVNGDANLVLPDGDIEISLRGADPVRPPTVAAPYVVEGRLAADASEIALERSFAIDLGIAVGDSVELRNEAVTASFEVVGLILDFNDCFYPQCDPGVTWASLDGLDALGPGGRHLSMYLRLADADAAPAFVTDTLRAHGDRLTGSQDWLDTRGDALAVNVFFGAFLSGFGVFVLVAAGIVVAGSVTNRVLARRRDIGLLKAVGVTPAQVVSSIMVEHLLLGGAAVVLGWILGSALVPSMRIGVTEVLEPGGVAWSPGPLVVTGVVVAIIVAVATVLPALRASRLSTAATLRPLVDPGRSAWPARIAGRLGAGPVLLGGVKDVVQRPLRTILAALSVVLAVVALIVTLGFGATVDMTTARPDVVGNPWDVLVVPAGDSNHDMLTETIASTPDVAAWFGEAEDRRVVDGQVVLARAVAGDPTAAAYLIREGRNMVAAGEGLAGYGLLQRLGRQVGDMVTVEIDDVEIPIRIVGRYSETEDSGEVLLFRWESVQAAFPDAAPSVYLVVAVTGTDRKELANDLQVALGGAVTVRPLVVDSDDVDAFAIAFWLVAGLVLAVALANLAATVLLGVRERMRDLGILRAIGFTPSQLVASTAIGTLLLVVAAVIVGIPIGLWLNRALLAAVGKAVGAGPELRASPAVVPTVVVVAAIVAAAVAIGALACVQASRRPVSELVNYE